MRVISASNCPNFCRCLHSPFKPECSFKVSAYSSLAIIYFRVCILETIRLYSLFALANFISLRLELLATLSSLISSLISFLLSLREYYPLSWASWFSSRARPSNSSLLADAFEAYFYLADDFLPRRFSYCIFRIFSPDLAFSIVILSIEWFFESSPSTSFLYFYSSIF